MTFPPVSSDAWLAALVESSNDAIISKTLAGIVTSWNASAERIFGYAAEEMVGQSILKIIPPERQDEEVLILDRIGRGERIDHFETKRRRKDGELVDISLTVSPIKDEAGIVQGVLKIARDVSEARRNREMQRLLMREVNHRSKNLLAVTSLGPGVGEDVSHQHAAELWPAICDAGRCGKFMPVHRIEIGARHLHPAVPDCPGQGQQDVLSSHWHGHEHKCRHQRGLNDVVPQSDHHNSK